MSKYRLAEPAPAGLYKDKLLSQLLYNRGFGNETDIQNFLFPDYEEHRHDPFLLNDMGKAVERVLLAIKNNERIAIYSDYDCDGIPGAVVLHDFFKAVGYESFQNYIPHRHHEGFGLNTAAIDKLAKDKVSLIITVDCGTADVEAIALAKKLGVDVIVTDHHLPAPRPSRQAGEPDYLLPEAVAIVNPKLDNYPFKELCGAGVVFKLVEALLQKGDFNFITGKEKWWLDMVALATVSDMVPLLGENRVLAHYGLRVLRKSRRPGLQHLLRKTRSDQRYLNEDDIGFTIAPRINAASRMDTPEDAFFMLSSSDESEAGARVEHLEKLNNERKGIVAAMVKELKHRVNEFTELPPVLVLGNPAWRPALVGLAANSLTEEFRRPVFLWGRDGGGLIKGSCRSEGTTSVVRLMEEVSENFLEHGGHHFSGGFTVKEEAIFTLPQKLNDAYLALGEQVSAAEETLIDSELKLEDVNQELVKNLRLLSPFGIGNPKPLFVFRSVSPTKVESFGKNREHLKLVFEVPRGRLEAIAFFSSPEGFAKKPEANKLLDLVAHVEESFFMNRLQTRLRVVDII